MDQAKEVRQKISRLEKEIKPVREPNIAEQEQRLREMTAKMEELSKNGKLDAANEMEKQIHQLKQRLQNIRQNRPEGERVQNPQRRPEGDRAQNQQRRPEGDRVAAEEKLRQMGKEIEELRRLGRQDDANRLEREARGLKEQLGRPADQQRRPEGDRVQNPQRRPEGDRAQNQQRRPEGDRIAAEEKLRQMGKEIEELRRSGRQDEANRLEEKARDMKAQLGRAQNQQRRPEGDRAAIEERVRQMGKEIEELRRSGRQDEANRLEERARNLKEQLGRPADQQKRPMGREGDAQIQHLKMAIENLHAAGLHETADHVMRRLEDMQRGRQPVQGPGMDQAMGMIKERIEQMQNQINELRQAIREMRGRNTERNR